MKIIVNRQAKECSLEKKKSKLALYKLKIIGFKIWLKKNYKKVHLSQVKFTLQSIYELVFKN